MLSSFSLTDSVLSSEENFHRLDDYLLPFKLAARFGSLTLSSSVACALCYPLDTLKRRLQVEGSLGYQNSGVYNEWKYASKML